MNDSKNNRWRALRIAVIGMALLNLIALFAFNYQLPSFLRFSSKKTSAVKESPLETACPYTFQLSSNTLSYDGTGSLNLLDGVSLTKQDGTSADFEIFAHISTGDSLDHKIITYSADTDAGQVTTKRNLTLDNYSGPSLVLPSTLPALAEDQLDSILEYMPTDGSFAAADGYGNDITSAVSVKYTIEPADPSLVHFVFSVTNLFNDTTSASADLIIVSSRPILVLTQTEVVLSKGASFQPLSYIQKAEDLQGRDLTSRIQIDGTIDVNTPGVYPLTYSVTDASGHQSLPQVLTVTIP